MSNSPYSASRDDNVGVGHRFDEEADAANIDQDFADNALSAIQLPTAGHDQAPRSTTPTRDTYPTPQQGGRLAD